MKKENREISERFSSILRGAFKGPPTPLKDIPKRHGGIRNLRNTNAGPSSDASVKTASPDKKNRGA